jgi:RNA polymerase sigma-70 factor (ECF subfamily)
VATEFKIASDEELARHTQAGSLVAFEELVRRYENRIYGFAANSSRSAVDAAEVTQDTFVRAFQAIGQFDPGRSFAGWLFAIARRKGIDHFNAGPTVSDEAIPDSPDLDDPAEILAQREDRANLWQIARRRLSQNQFQALWLRYAEDLTLEEIARILGKTRTHVKVLLFRARQGMEAALSEFGSGFTLRSDSKANPREPAAHRPSGKIATAVASNPLTWATEKAPI